MNAQSTFVRDEILYVKKIVIIIISGKKERILTGKPSPFLPARHLRLNPYQKVRKLDPLLLLWGTKTRYPLRKEIPALSQQRNRKDVVRAIPK